jgi:hypothetical protein
MGKHEDRGRTKAGGIARPQEHQESDEEFEFGNLPPPPKKQKRSSGQGAVVPDAIPPGSQLKVSRKWHFQKCPHARIIHQKKWEQKVEI